MNAHTSYTTTVAVTGATGYVGGRLVQALLDAGYQVRCIVREPRKLADRPWRNDPRVSVVKDDLSDSTQLAEHLAGCDAGYYLVHSMQVSGAQYAEHDRTLARVFAEASESAKLGRIIYLGGLGELGTGLSEHLSSRREVERVLASTGVPVTVFRAAMIIGSGSASFEILRYLVERLPVMVTPSWVKTESQPVAIADVLYWLVRCLDVPETVGKTLEIGGSDVLTYRELMKVMAEELGLPRRLIVPLPVLTPRLSSGWISLVTPVSYRIARPLAEGLRNRVVVNDDLAQKLMPHKAMGAREAIKKALQRTRSNEVETRWSVAGPVPGDPSWAGGTVFTDDRSIVVKAPASSVFRAVCRVGGGNGWYAGDLLWRIRGWMDTLAGGPGLRRGRRHPERVEFGETLDFWRVTGIEHERSLKLLAEMKLPGTATLEFDLAPENRTEGTRLSMTARFRPRGFIGLLYWYAVLPLHNIVFGGMLRGIKRAAEEDIPEAEAHNQPTPASSRYGRARLWLGMSAVGTIVTLTSLALVTGLPERAAALFPEHLPGQIGLLLAFVLTYAILHLPFDLFGGYLLARSYEREHPSFGHFLIGLARGAVVQSLVLILTGVGLLLAGQAAGLSGVVGAGVAISILLLWIRAPLARTVASFGPTNPVPSSRDDPAAALPTVCVSSDDEGFTGGITGVLRPRRNVLPDRWRDTLGPDGFAVAETRRDIVVRTGGWRRGRIVALLFTWTGLAGAAAIVGSEDLARAQGIVELSLYFTIWSFLGLLVLPTLSRSGVAAVDKQLQEMGFDQGLIEGTLHRLDDLQDGERSRPSIVETIFHPIPSVHNRLDGPRNHQTRGYWDVARSAVYLSASGLSLLGRAVHCNCGRPALWVFLPAD